MSALDERAHKIIINTVNEVREGGRYQGRQRPHKPGEFIDVSDLGGMLVPDVINNPNSVVTKEYVDSLVGTPIKYYTKVLSATDISNKYITLPIPPVEPESVTIQVDQAPNQAPLIDFILDLPANIDWNGLGLDGILEAGDIMHVLYY